MPSADPKAPRRLELLAPARDAATARVAILHGADAVYMGGPAFGARAAAGNSLDDIRSVVEMAHRFGVKVYITLNTIIYDDELADVRALVHDLYHLGVDALIVQDMALLTMDIPPIDLHASTQCDSRSPGKIAWLSRAGFSQIVLPREFTLGQIQEAASAAAPARLEAFVHGALCVSYSGDCHAGALTMGRSANRGECPQICRLKFTLTDAAGKPVTPPDGRSASRHWLSLADMCRLADLQQMADAGVSSFKIEGRLKSPEYVKEVVSAYSRALDRIVSDSDGKYIRASYGLAVHSFMPDVNAVFNRGFTKYFLTPDSFTGISSTRSPKWTGRPVATLLKSTPKGLSVKSSAEIHAGDGLGWFDADDNFHGFRVNRLDERGMIVPAPKSDLPSCPGTKLFRNSDYVHERLLARDDTARRKISVSMTLRTDASGRLVIDIVDERGVAVSVASDDIFDEIAKTSQKDARHATLSRLGDTIYELTALDDRLGDIFVPAKALTGLRRAAIDALDRAWRIMYRPAQRATASLSPDVLAGLSLDYHANVANKMAAAFYKSHGAEVLERAVEVQSSPAAEKRVMTTRYCIRRELGQCLRKNCSEKALPAGDLYLTAPVGRFRVHFDCPNCQMQIYLI